MEKKYVKVRVTVRVQDLRVRIRFKITVRIIKIHYYPFSKIKPNSMFFGPMAFGFPN